MMADANGQPRYNVSIPVAIRERLTAWGGPAGQLGLFDEYIADLKWVDEELTLRPAEWGDPLRDWEQAGLKLFRGMSAHLVYYAVHLVRRYVFIRDIVLRPDRPLGQADPPPA
jgi:hypothetical protein